MWLMSSEQCAMLYSRYYGKNEGKYNSELLIYNNIQKYFYYNTFNFYLKFAVNRLNYLDRFSLNINIWCFEYVENKISKKFSLPMVITLFLSVDANMFDHGYTANFYEH